jgi:hypothetical protein
MMTKEQANKLRKLIACGDTRALYEAINEMTIECHPVRADIVRMLFRVQPVKLFVLCELLDYFDRKDVLNTVRVLINEGIVSLGVDWKLKLTEKGLDEASKNWKWA